MTKKTKDPKPGKFITTWPSAWQPLSSGHATLSWHGTWERGCSLCPKLHGPLFVSLMACPMPERCFLNSG